MLSGTREECEPMPESKTVARPTYLLVQAHVTILDGLADEG
jgi:hypothetical protein